MKPEDVRVALLRIEGANCEEEMAQAFQALGAKAEHVHLNQVTHGRAAKPLQRSLLDYDVLVLPGGFSAGDYVRAGAIFAARLKAAAGRELETFHDEGRPILGVCNGFQVLVEMGLLPGTKKGIGPVTAALSTNDSARFECRPVFLKHEKGRCKVTTRLRRNQIVCFPNAHGEGKLVLAPSVTPDQLESDKQVVFRYTRPDGGEPAYPFDPNGAVHHIAGLTDPTGTVLGVMPHPERAFWGWQHPFWTRRKDPQAFASGPGDGRAVFESVLEQACKAA